MTSARRLLIPASQRHTEIVVVNSRFIASIAPAFSVEEARAFIASVRIAYPDATHHVPAFIIGHGASITEHCSDDGEPQGTAGRPVLAVLKGSGLGDAVVVVTRYFGGTKLGTGGLVRAYTDAAKAVLSGLPLAEKIATVTAVIVLPYPFYDRVRLLMTELDGLILDQNFAADVTLTVQFKEDQFSEFQSALKDLSNGRLQAILTESNPEAIFPIKPAS